MMATTRRTAATSIASAPTPPPEPAAPSAPVAAAGPPRDSVMPALVTSALVGSFCFALLAPIFVDVPPDVRQDILLGLAPLAGGAVSYWLGSSRTQDKVTERQNAVVTHKEDP